MHLTEIQEDEICGVGTFPPDQQNPTLGSQAIVKLQLSAVSSCQDILRVRQAQLKDGVGSEKWTDFFAEICSFSTTRGHRLQTAVLNHRLS